MTRGRDDCRPASAGKRSEKKPHRKKGGDLHRPDGHSAASGNPAKQLPADGWVVPQWMQILLLAVAVGCVYGHTLDVPFYLDDAFSIVDNPSLASWNDFHSIWSYAHLRFLGYVSFALNREWNGLNVAGYHVVNLVIHFLAGVSVFALAKGLLKTPALQERGSRPNLKWFPLVSALLFLVHPLQTQAVTYIVQRLASLAGLFYLASLAFYLHGQLAGHKMKKRLLFAGSVLLGVCAFFTKQNTVTLPLAILLTEVIFFRMPRRRLMTVLVLLAAGLAAGWVLLSAVMGQNPFSLKILEALTRETGDISRGEYLATQTKVLWIYIRDFLMPTALHLDHDVEIVPGILAWQPLLFLAGHFLLLTFAYFSAKKYPVVSFGIFFYYVAHIVESGLIPIRDVLFEHRTYLPNAGLCLAAGWGAAGGFPGRVGKRIAGWAAVSVLMVLSVLAWQRNELWRSPIDLWKDNARRAPGNFRVWDTLAQYYLEAGMNPEAAQALNNGAELRKQMPLGFVHWPAVISQITVLRRQGKLDEALSTADFYLQKHPIARLRSKILASKGNIYIETKEYLKAEECFREALDIYPDNSAALVNLGIVLFQQGKQEGAKEVFIRALKQNPGQDMARKYLNLMSHKG